MSFKVIPITQEIVDKVRETGKSSWAKLPASTAIAGGYGPCRSCLKTFTAGKDERTFFTYNPFDGLADLPLPGPVFIHAGECEAYNSDEFPPDLRNIPMLFEAFDADGKMLQRVKVEEPMIETQIGDILNVSKTSYIYVRNAEAGCFIMRIERE
jgi:hypothetical protein